MLGRKTPTVDEQREAFADALMDVTTLVQPLFDAAEGMKANLLSRGWSPDVAEYLAGQWLAAGLSRVGRGE
ncbi:hypothetical protein [Streptomyces sp. NPDC006638]|uniref:hypothetical protein n=1 Tax=Streptomyces sp. NPDC006638 TaxID=3157183 RepID=UPI0033A8722D